MPLLHVEDDDVPHKTNAKEELLYFLVADCVHDRGLDKVSSTRGPHVPLCVEIKYCPELDVDYVYGDNTGELPPILVNLPVGYSPEEYNSFLETLSSINYYAGYGLQCLFGMLWFTDNSWAERHEYDGSEWWCYMSQPTIPDHLLYKKLAP